MLLLENLQNRRVQGRSSVLLTDGLPSYVDATKREFPEAIHLSKVGIQGRVNNNRIERYIGTFKDRKVMRAIKTSDSPFIEGQRIYYNYIRPHQSLNGLTPAEKAGIKLQLDGNKWLELIKRSQSETRKT